MLKNKIIICIDINAFFASVEEANDPSLKDKPIVVGGVTKRSVVASPNYKARAYGIKAGMPIFQAQKMCSKLVVVNHKFHLYEDYSQRFIKLLCERISNKIEYLSIDECYMDITNLVDQNNTPIKIATKIQKLVKSGLNLGTSIGISYNRFLAKMGSDYKKPMGITQILTFDDVKKIIWPQPIGNMYFVGKSSETKLIDLGIKTIGDLANTKNHEMLKSVFGKNWKDFLNNANGIGDDELEYSYGDPKSVSLSRTLLNDTRDFNEIKMLLKEFLADVCNRLTRDNTVGRTLVVLIKNSNFKLHTKSFTLPKYTNDYEYLLPIALKLYEENFSGISVRLVGVGVSNLTKQDCYLSDEFFDKKNPKKIDKNELNNIIESVNKKFSKNILKKASELNRK